MSDTFYYSKGDTPDIVSQRWKLKHLKLSDCTYKPPQLREGEICPVKLESFQVNLGWVHVTTDMSRFTQLDQIERINTPIGFCTAMIGDWGVDVASPFRSLKHLTLSGRAVPFDNVLRLLPEAKKLDQLTVLFYLDSTEVKLSEILSTPFTDKSHKTILIIEKINFDLHLEGMAQEMSETDRKTDIKHTAL